MPYSGETVTIPMGELGLLTDLAPGSIPPNALIKATNITFNLGSIEKAPGSRKYNAVALSAGIVALFDWHPDNITQRLIAATSDGKIFRDIGDELFSGGVAIKSGLEGLTTRDRFVEGGKETASAVKKLFLFSTNNQVQVLEGDAATFSTIDSPAADWTTPNFPTTAVVHQNRLWAFLKQRAYASDTGNHENFVSNILTNNIGPGEGGDIIAAQVYKGRLFVAKEGNFIYFLDDTDVNSDNWVFRKLDDGIGMASSHSFLQVLNDLTGANTTGSITSLKATQAFGDIESGDILGLAKIEGFIRDNSSLSGLPFIHTLYYEVKKRAYYTFRSAITNKNDRMLVADVGIPGNTRYSIYDKDVPEVLASRKDINGILRPIYGDNTGFVFLMDQEDRLVGGSSYEGSFQSPHMDFRQLAPQLAHMEKHYDWLVVEFVPQGSHNLNADIFIDGVFRETVTFPMKNRTDGLASSASSGGFTLDKDKLGRLDAQWSAKRTLHGTGKTISVRFFNAGSNENFKISSWTVGFRPAGDNTTRI